METLKMVIGTLLTPVAGVATYIESASTAYKKEKQVAYFQSVQNTLPVEKQQKEDDIRERAHTISELWNQ